MKHRFISSLTAAALFALAPGLAHAFTVNVAEDASSTAAHMITPATGKATSLPVNANPAVVPDAVALANLSSATLRLYVVGIKPGNLTVQSFTGNWTETPLKASG